MQLNEAIYQIEHVYHAQYDPTTLLFDAYDQFLACESIAESSPVLPTYYLEKDKNNVIVNIDVNGNDDGICKRRVNFELTGSKLRAIALLNDFSHEIPSTEIEKHLTEIFCEYPSTPGWWLHVAQHWTQRQIYWTLSRVIKLQSLGQVRKTPAHCFSFLIKHRKKKIKFINTNDGC